MVDVDPFQLYNKEPKLKFEYRYDAEGNVTYEFKRDSNAVEGLKETTNYSYDALNRLTTAGDKSYEYDSLGNLIREKGPTKQDVTTYAYNSLNQLTGKKECGYVQSICMKGTNNV